MSCDVTGVNNLTYRWDIIVNLNFHHGHHSKSSQQSRSSTRGFQLCSAEIEVLPMIDVLVYSFHRHSKIENSNMLRLIFRMVTCLYWWYHLQPEAVRISERQNFPERKTIIYEQKLSLAGVIDKHEGTHHLLLLV